MPPITSEQRVKLFDDSIEGAGLLWCPFAETDFPASKTSGEYKGGYPIGATVHYTGGRRRGLEGGLASQVDRKYTYFLIDKDGNIGQNFPLNRWGSHSGESIYDGLSIDPGMKGISNKLVGIEIQCAGRIGSTDREKKNWKTRIPEADLRVVEHRDGNRKPGSYQKYTPEQEKSLTLLLRWLKRNKPETFSFDYVVGHDEISPDRKSDPGGSLSVTMPQLRKSLNALDS